MKLLNCLVIIWALPLTTYANTLTVYSAGPQALIDELASVYGEKSGVRTNVFQSTTGQVMARLESERRNPLADVVISASWNSAEALKEQGLLKAYEPEHPDLIPEFLRDSHYVAQGAAALAILVNTRRDKPTPTDWDDLAGPAFRGEVTMPDPAQSGTAFELVLGLLTSRGEEQGWQLFEDLADNDMLVPGPNARALNPVLQGAKAAVFGGVDYIAYRQQAAGESIDIVFPESGTVIAPRPMMIMASTQQPEAARAFLDFVLSERGQTIVAQHYLIPSRSDVAGNRPGLNELKLLDVDPDVAGGRAATLEKFRAVQSR